MADDRDSATDKLSKTDDEARDEMAKAAEVNRQEVADERRGDDAERHERQANAVRSGENPRRMDED